MSKRILAGLVCLAFLALTGSALSQQQPQNSRPPASLQAEKSVAPAPQAETATAPEPDPRQILQKMCDFLKSQQQFYLQSRGRRRPGVRRRQETPVRH